MRAFISVVRATALSTLCLFAAPALAQDTSILPERRVVVSRDTDFPGGDLASIFDTTYEACRAACLSDNRCVAFTFNSRSGSCFPKGTAGAKVSYPGATSAVVLATDPAALARAPDRKAELAFLGAADFAAARAQSAGMADRHPVDDFTAEDYAAAAARSRAEGDTWNAVAFSGQAVVLADSADLWRTHAEDLLAQAGAGVGDVRVARARALSASVNAYLREEGPAGRAAALLAMAQALEATGRGRTSLSALRLAADVSPREDIAAARDRAARQFGFRVEKHVVESDPASPRICAQFSEQLAEAGVDYAPFVRLPGSGFAVEAEGTRLCVSGLSHGARYSVTFRQGLPAASGEVLSEDVALNLYVRDRSPSVRFPGRAYVLPRGGEAAVPVVTVNAPALDLVLRRVSDRNLLRAIQSDYFGRPVAQWQQVTFSTEVSEEVWRGTAAVEGALNRDATTRLPLSEAIDGLSPGIYALQARVQGADPRENPAATQWFVISDLGLATLSGVDGLHVFVRGLRSAEPKAGVRLALVSRANAVLGEATTDAQGYALFPPGLTRGTGGAVPALVTAEDGDEDLAFLSLTDPEFDLSDRGVEGREPAPPIDLFLATDRGAYRAGETIHLTALARDGAAKAIEGLPLTAILTRPDGVEYSRHLSDASVAGGHVFALPVAGSAPRGGWTVAVHADVKAPPLARTTVLVEDFLPERIDFALSLPEGPISPADTADLTVEARYLFGPPGADLAVEGSVMLRAADSLPGFEGYRFGRHDAPFETRFGVIVTARTDEAGRAVLPVTFPPIVAPDRPVEAQVVVTVAEGSGRPVERRLERLLAPSSALIGVRPAFEGVVPEGAEARFQVIAVDPALRRTAMPVRWILNRVETDWQWYQLYGQWQWEPVTTRTRVAEGTATLSADEVLEVASPVEWGTYELRVERTDGTFAATSVPFHAGWYAPADATETPDTLSVSLDRPDYRPGDTATLRVVPRAAGKGLVTVVSNHLISMQAVDFAEGENLVTLPVTDAWGTGAYVTATLIRPMDASAGRNPSRALGLAHAAVDPGPRRLGASFEVAPEADPRGPLPVALRVEGIAAGETAYATIAAVDVGILNLTGHASPDPQGHYFGQRKLGVGMRDVYGRLIDGMNGALGEVRSGGDAMAEKHLNSNPPTEDLVAFFTGPVEVGADGLARAAFDLPAFNGTVRLMAVVWSPTGVGQADAEVLVRDPVVVTASVPRFLAPGDTSRLLLEVVHASGPSGRMGLDVTGSGLSLGAVPSGVDLAAQGKASLSVPIVATDSGLATLRVALTTPDGRQLTKDLTLPVRSNDPELSRQVRLTLAAGQTFTFDQAVFAGLVPGSGTATLAAGPLARFDAPGLLAALDRYPYGCTEQITSAAMPLLYFDEMARVMGLAAQATAAERIGQAIAEVLTNQASNGAFGLWGPSSGDLWLDAYVTDFLSRAKAKGHDVPDRAFRMALDNLRNAVNYYTDFDEGGQDLAYALHVLAREGAAAVGDLRYYADVKGDAFGSPLAAAQIGAALAAYGDQTRADAMFTRAARKLDGPAENTALWRADYGTRLRDTAGVLALALESRSEAVDREALAARIGNAGQGRSTQEALWTLLAAHALTGDPATRLTIDGVPADGPLVRVLEADAGGPGIAIRNDGPGDETITLTTFGVPSDPEPAGGNGWAISRGYYTLDGVAADPERVALGTRLVTVLEVQPFGAREARLMVADPLPAGFEIDNPNLLRAGDIRALDWLDATAGAEHTEARSDRFLAAVDHYGDQPFRLAYIVRAISPGAFHHPAASVEDMYRPEFRARTAAGRVTVTE